MNDFGQFKGLIGLPILLNLRLNIHYFVKLSNLRYKDYVVTFCDEANETCPGFAGKVKHRMHIGFEDPSKAKGSAEFIYREFKRIRDEIKRRFFELYVHNFKMK